MDPPSCGTRHGPRGDGWRLKAAFSLVLAVPVAVAIIVILLGLRPDLDAALYRTILVLLMVGAGGALLELVYSQRRPASA